MDIKFDFSACFFPVDDSTEEERRHAAADSLSILLKTSKSSEEAKALTSEDVAALLA